MYCMAAGFEQDIDSISRAKGDQRSSILAAAPRVDYYTDRPGHKQNRPHILHRLAASVYTLSGHLRYTAASASLLAIPDQSYPSSA